MRPKITNNKTNIKVEMVTAGERAETYESLRHIISLSKEKAHIPKQKGAFFFLLDPGNKQT